MAQTTGDERKRIFADAMHRGLEIGIIEAWDYEEIGASSEGQVFRWATGAGAPCAQRRNEILQLLYRKMENRGGPMTPWLIVRDMLEEAGEKHLKRGCPRGAEGCDVCYRFR